MAPHSLFSPSSAKWIHMTYQLTDRIFSIVEPSLDLHLEEGAQGMSAEKLFYENGVVQSECFYRNNRLHGPSRFFSEEGTLLSETWFWNGEQQGIARFFYRTGALYARLCYRHGKKVGRQDYFYENGEKKTVEEYADGLLHGPSVLYWPNGRMKRQSEFSQGRRIATDQFWNEEGLAIQDSCSSSGDRGLHDNPS
jgi:antitoxin component YwqK of YwqJK toxin-antitoxin module